GWLVVGSVSEHGEEDVAAAAGQADEGGVVALALGAFAVVVGPTGGVGQGGEGGEGEGPVELFVAAFGWTFAADAGAGSAGDWGQPGVGGQVPWGGKGGAVADVEQDAGGGPDADAGHRGQDAGKRVRIEHFLDLVGDVIALRENGFQRGGQFRQDGLGGGRAGHGDGLLA